MNKKTKDFILRSILRIFLIIISLMMVVPFLWMITTSLKTSDQIFTWPPEWIPKPVIWSNYIDATTFFPFFRYLLNTAFITICIVIGQLITCSMGGYAFARVRFPGRDTLFILYIATMMIPGQVTIIPVYILFKWLHWIDTYYAVIVPGLFSAFGTFLLRQFFLTIPRELEEAAIIDGCSIFGIYHRIILPLSKPALATLGIFTFMGAWNSFFWPLIVLNSQERMTLSVGLALFVGPFDTTFNTLMAASTLVLLPVILAYVFAQGYFVRGITLSGLKG
jgi:multiple sugar transport system permease protein